MERHPRQRWRAAGEVIGRALVAVGVLFAGAVAGARSADDYLALLHLYRDHPARAVQAMAKLSGDAITRGIQQCRAGRCSLQQIRTAAMLHADAAELQIGLLGQAASNQIGFGRELLQIAGNIATNTHVPASEVRALTSFGSRWYAMTARLLLTHGHFEVARLVAVEGRIRYPESPDLFVVTGLLTEWRAGLGWDAGDLRGFIIRGELFDRGFGTSMPFRGNVTADLETAARDYRRAISIAPGHAGARLRLAWVHLLADDGRVWEDVPTGFVTEASHEAQYLAHLLRGTAAERQRNAAAALAEYSAARMVVPNSQTACVAVSSAQAQSGQLGEARRTAGECLERGAGAATVDAWTLFRMGLMDATTVDGLREEARRP